MAKNREGSHYKVRHYSELINTKHLWLIKEFVSTIDEFPKLFNEWTKISPEGVTRLEPKGYLSLSRFYRKKPNLTIDVLRSLATSTKFYEPKARKLTFGSLRGLLDLVCDLKNPVPLNFSPKIIALLKRQYPIPALEVIAACYNGASIINFGLPLGAVYSIAKKGNDEFLFKLLQIDKSVIYEKWVARRIRKAHFFNQKKFLYKLSNAIQKDPISPKRKQIKVFFVLSLLVVLGVWRKLTYSQICDLLADNKIANLDEVALRCLARRYRLKKKGRM